MPELFCHNLRSTACRNYITYRMASWAECRENQTPETEITNNAPPADNSNLPPVTEQPLDEDGQSVWTSTDGVNFRAEPNTDSEILTVLVTGTKLTLLGEENGWVQAEYNGQKDMSVQTMLPIRNRIQQRRKQSNGKGKQ